MTIDSATVDLLKILSSTALLLSASYAAFFLGRSYYRFWRAQTSENPLVLKRAALNDRTLSTLLPGKIFALTAVGLILGLIVVALEIIDFICPTFLS